ncbi:MAG: glycosyltransferase family 2 protein, partial [Janthinobacterium lividum]
ACAQQEAEGSRLRTAIGLCLRNEDPAPAAAVLGRLGVALDAAGLSDRFALCLLSDSDRSEAAAEDAAARALATATATAVLLRRRTDNAGWKAGNVMSFLDGPGAAFDLFLCLDSDSDMTLPAVLRLVRLMAADERLAIVQATFAAPPAVPGRTTRFARDFALGHSAGLRVWATGQAWWQGDQGPYWGHNAVLRVAPFRAHCRLGPLPDGSAILSHDHVEAARLHAAGWKVRVLPDDAGSHEGTPPTLPDYLGRDVRWAAGNLQYRHLLRDRSLGRIGRLQMAQAILHYALTPAWFAMLPLAAWTALAMPHAASLRLVTAALVAGWAATALPKLLGHAEALARPPRHAEAGHAEADGRAGRALAALREVGMGLLLDPILALEKTAIMMAAPLRPRAGWAAQAREGRRLGWGGAILRFWPHTLVGLLLLALFCVASWRAALLCLPAVAGLVAAVPYAVLGSRPVR